MKSYKAILFDLDNTLLNRNLAVEKWFLLILEKCYGDVNHSVKNDMLQKFKENDKRSYGDPNKISVLESFFEEYPPNYRIASSSIPDFWNQHFPRCFSIEPSTFNILNTLKMHMKIAIITNGSTQRQKAKIMNTNLNNYFDTVIISEEVGFSKPDKRIFELALTRLEVQPEDALFVGDDIERDIGGCQNANMKGIWFNPNRKIKDTEIKPYAEIHSLEKLLRYLN